MGTKLDRVISFRAEPALLKRIKALAAKEERRLADTVRRLVLKALGKVTR